MAEHHPTYEEWLATRPLAVQKAAEKYPIGTVFKVDGADYYLVGWDEVGRPKASPIDPRVDYEKSIAQAVTLFVLNPDESKAKL